MSSKLQEKLRSLNCQIKGQYSRSDRDLTWRLTTNSYWMQQFHFKVTASNNCSISIQSPSCMSKSPSPSSPLESQIPSTCFSAGFQSPDLTIHSLLGQHRKKAQLSHTLSRFRYPITEIEWWGENQGGHPPLSPDDNATQHPTHPQGGVPPLLATKLYNVAT